MLLFLINQLLELMSFINNSGVNYFLKAIYVDIDVKSCMYLIKNTKHVNISFMLRNAHKQIFFRCFTSVCCTYSSACL